MIPEYILLDFASHAPRSSSFCCLYDALGLKSQEGLTSGRPLEIVNGVGGKGEDNMSD